MPSAPQETPVGLSVADYIDRALAREREIMKAELGKFGIKYDTQREGDKEALKIYAEDMDRRLDAHNKFREQIERERGEYLTRDLYDREHTGLDDRIKELEVSRGNQVGKSAAYASIAGGLGV
jgi:hypothetical protein